MAYERRRLVNNLSGTLAARVSATDTQITCQGAAPGISNVFAALPTDFSSTLYMPLVLANDSTGKFEIVWVTGHASASPTLTVIRNREGTDAQTFEVGDTVRCAATVRDLELLVANYAALPSDPHVGMRAYLLDLGIAVEYAAAGWFEASGTTTYRLWARMTADLALPAATQTQLVNLAAASDPRSMLSGNALTIPQVWGSNAQFWWRVQLHSRFAQVASANRLLTINRNSTSPSNANVLVVDSEPISNGNPNGDLYDAVYEGPLNPGDVLRFYAYSSVASALSTATVVTSNPPGDTWISARCLGPF